MVRGGAQLRIVCAVACVCVCLRGLISLLTKQRGVHQQQIPLQLFRGLAWKMNGCFLEWEVQRCSGSSQFFSLLHTHTEVRPSNWFLSAVLVDHCFCLVIGLDHNHWAAAPISFTLRYWDSVRYFFDTNSCLVYSLLTIEGKELNVNSLLTCTTSILETAPNFILECNGKTLQKFQWKKRLASMAFK